MEYKQLTPDNLEAEHICCQITDKKGENCVSSKKAWLRERLDEGLVFLKLDARGKVFIEYLPAENAWAPIEAPDYMYIDCFWVSGKYKGCGHANQLLDRCIADAKEKGKKGLVILSSQKKKPFLSDPKFLKYKGFRVADTAAPYFELLYLPFDEDAAVPCFRECAKNGSIAEKDWTIYYSHQCPHTAKYVPLLVEYAKSRGIDIKTVRMENAAQAQSAPTPFTTHAVFYNGVFVTNEILSEKSFEKLLVKLELQG